MKYRRFVLGIVAANEKQVGRVEGVVRRCERGGATETVPAEFTTGGYAAARDCDGLICVGAGMCRAWFTSASPSDAGTAATCWERHGWWWQQGLWRFGAGHRGAVRAHHGGIQVWGDLGGTARGAGGCQHRRRQTRAGRAAAPDDHG